MFPSAYSQRWGSEEELSTHKKIPNFFQLWDFHILYGVPRLLCLISGWARCSPAPAPALSQQIVFAQTQQPVSQSTAPDEGKSSQSVPCLSLTEAVIQQLVLLTPISGQFLGCLLASHHQLQLQAGLLPPAPSANADPAGTSFQQQCGHISGDGSPGVLYGKANVLRN